MTSQDAPGSAIARSRGVLAVLKTTGNNLCNRLCGLAQSFHALVLASAGVPFAAFSQRKKPGISTLARHSLPMENGLWYDPATLGRL